jgi:hypothetical protein
MLGLAAPVLPGRAGASTRVATAGVSAAAVSPVLRWSRTFSCPGAASNRCGFLQSSPVPVNFDGRPAIAEGSQDGRVYVVHQSDGSDVPGWPVATGNPIESSPSVAATDATGQPSLFIGTGQAGINAGAQQSYDRSGHQRWNFLPTDPQNGNLAVTSTMAIGDVTGDGIPDVTAGALGLQMFSLTQAGVVNGGWPYYTDDTVFSSPGLVDVNGDGVPDVVIGGDSAPGGPIPWQGGVLRAISGHGGTMWQDQFNDTIESSPTVGDVGLGRPQIFVGGGDYYTRTLRQWQSDSTKLNQVELNGSVSRRWDLGAFTKASPTLADVLGTGQLDVVEGTWGGQGAAYLPDKTAPGKVWVLDPRTGGTIWQGHIPGVDNVLAEITTADLNGDGAQDLLIPSGSQVVLFDVKNQQVLGNLAVGVAAFQNSPLVIDNGDGSLDIVIAGQEPDGSGVMFDYTIPAASRPSLGALGTPMFRKDARRTGSWTNPPLTVNPCPPPGGGGYWLVATDGGIFAFCDAKFYGSTGGLVLNRPVVGMASTRSGRGYWLVATDGGIFTFGDAKFFGSTGGLPLNKPVVGMAPTPDGNGYWLVATDGGIFTFGDAKFFGSTGGLRLNKPIVGMAPTPDGNGYWLVATDGGIFTFGDAKFLGSTGGLPLNKPVVGMAPTPTGNGYWLAATDGGIFTFGDARFFGSTGGLPLNKPVVGMAPTPDGNGYWLVATDGGIFTFGDAPFVGSTGSYRLNQPVIGMAAPG